jgi:hypothetical protein
MCIALVWSNWYILTLIVERQTYERIVIDQLTIRYTDVARIGKYYVHSVGVFHYF